MSWSSLTKFAAGSLQASGASLKSAVTPFKDGDKDSSYSQEVIKKVKGHPQFRDLPSSEVKDLAKKLTSIEAMKEYFSEFLVVSQEQVLQITTPPNDDQQTTSAATPAADNGAPQFNSEDTLQARGASINTASSDADNPRLDLYSHIKDVATFPVKLYLTPLPPDDTMADNSFASHLETTYGPMHAALQVGHTMIEWSPYHLVVPHYNIPPEAAIKTDITRSLTIAGELRAKAREYKESVTGEVDLMYEISKSINSVIEEIVRVAVSWNRYKYFHPYGTNSQHFVQNIMKVLGIEELPLTSQNLTPYIGRLKGDFKSNEDVSFRIHEDLDRYVEQRIGTLSTGEMEYLLTEYYRFHVASRAEAVHAAGEWRCSEKQCQIQRLEREIDGKELLITSLRVT